ncbi:hypothetical protein [Cohnella sp. WQ 127256]|uniref:hypothetical protein n=1 Tax=Cohnella sp. WQ 127256 TaxID=2938790 RepID=UPI002117DF0A|nr:hypothetical protein [Cohnella sp. WQ 127256]
MATGKRLSNYEKAIATELQTLFDYTPVEAKEIVDEYRAVMEMLGGYPMAADYAEYFHKAKQEGRTGKEWLNAIMKRREEAAAVAQ